MAWALNGKQRSLKLKITKIGTDNSSIIFYEDGVSGFTSTGGTHYTSLYDLTGGTDNFARLTDSEFITRLGDWEGYLTNKYAISEPNLVGNIDFSLTSGNTLTELVVELNLVNGEDLQVRTDAPVISTLICTVNERFGNGGVDQIIYLTLQSGNIVSDNFTVNTNLHYYTFENISPVQDSSYIYIKSINPSVPTQ